MTTVTLRNSQNPQQQDPFYLLYSEVFREIGNYAVRADVQLSVVPWEKVTPYTDNFVVRIDVVNGLKPHELEAHLTSTLSIKKTECYLQRNPVTGTISAYLTIYPDAAEALARLSYTPSKAVRLERFVRRLLGLAILLGALYFVVLYVLPFVLSSAWQNVHRINPAPLTRTLWDLLPTVTWAAAPVPAAGAPMAAEVVRQARMGHPGPMPNQL